MCWKIVKLVREPESSCVICGSVIPEGDTLCSDCHLNAGMLSLIYLEDPELFNEMTDDFFVEDGLDDL